MSVKPAKGTKCTCGCGSSSLNLTIDNRRWFVDKEHVLAYISKREAESSEESEEKKIKRPRTKKNPRKKTT
ncbi:MAG: hypothetical protein ACFFB3_16250 [Candidatus Hodarchaeota archaeon]